MKNGWSLLYKKHQQTLILSPYSAVLNFTYCDENDGCWWWRWWWSVLACVCKLHNCILPSKQMPFNANCFDTSEMKCCQCGGPLLQSYVAIIVSMTANHNFCYWRGKWPAIQVTNVTSFSFLIMKWVCAFLFLSTYIYVCASTTPIYDIAFNLSFSSDCRT